MTTAATTPAPSMTEEITPAQFPAYIAANAGRYGLDPQAVLAVASKEGLSGAIGDQGSSYGPFQLRINGALPAQYGALGTYSQQTQGWAWSPAGINYALLRIASVAKGQTGAQAVTSIVYGFERPADPAAETAGAISNYGHVATPSSSGGGGGILGGVEGAVGDIASSGGNPIVIGGEIAGAVGSALLPSSLDPSKILGGWVGDLTGWIGAEATTGLAYVMFVFLGLVLVVLGALDVFGYSPKRVVGGLGKQLGGAALSGEIPF